MSWVGPEQDPAVSVVIVSYNARDELRRCLASLDGVSIPLEVIVVDNASHDASQEVAAAAFPSAVLIRNTVNAGFARASNQGLRRARAPLALILNPDALVCPGAVEVMARILEERKDVGAIGPKTLNPDGSVQVSFGPPLQPLAEWRQKRLVHGVRKRAAWALREAERQAAVEHEPFWVSGSCMLGRLAALREVGFFDEGFFLYEEDVDLCLRLRQAGWRILYSPAARITHSLGASAGREPALAQLEYQRSHLRYYRKHNGNVLTALLRLYLACAAIVGWATRLGPGDVRREQRRRQSNLLRLALRKT